ncbi:MAG: hypothetical protein ABI811_15395 [Acidobacteriota bacterium]
MPSATYLILNPDLPTFGEFHDDTLYFVGAKSLAAGDGYRIASLPGQPPQTKYPPLYPLVLSAAWRFGPAFPANLQMAGWISWLAMPALFLLMPSLFARWGLSGRRMWLLLIVFALNPYVIWLSTELLTELPFLALALAAMILIERSREHEAPVAVALAAGIVAGLAYLTRSAGLALLPAGFLYLLLRGKGFRGRKKAIGFAAAMLPLMAAWIVWQQMHLTPTSDPSLTYYTDYAGYQRMNVSLQDFPLYLWRNLDGFLLGLGSLVIPKIVSSLLLKILAQSIAVAMISGVVRMVRQGRAELYAMFAAASTVLLLIWHYPPDERFVMPLWPLAFAGLLTELEHVTAMLRAARQHKDRSQRVAALGVMAGVVVIFGGALAYQIVVDVSFLPEDAASHRAQRVEQVKAFDWIHANVPGDAAFYAHLDPLLYLYTGHAATSRPLLPRYWYHEDHKAIVDYWGNVAEFARTHKLDYYYAPDVDLTHGLVEEDHQGIVKALEASPSLEKVYRAGEVTIYHFRDASRAGATGHHTEVPPQAQ